MTRKFSAHSPLLLSLQCYKIVIDTKQLFFIYFFFTVLALFAIRLSQLDLKLQLDSLAAELKRLSLAQTDYLFSVPTTQSPASADKTNPSTTPTNTSALLDGYARRLCGARAKIAVVGNILESTQVPI